MPSITNTVSTIRPRSDGPSLTYAQILRQIAVAPVAVVTAGVVTFPPGLTVADMAARATLIASCDSAGTNITLSSGDKTLALALTDAFYFSVVNADVVSFRAALASA